MVRAFLITLVLFSGCGSAPMDPFWLYRRAFEQATRISTLGVPIEFKNLPARQVGVCYFDQDSRRIYVDPDFWKNSSIYSREALILHELGHCVLNRDHDSRLFKDGCPYSNMYPSMTSDACYLKHRPHYTRELGKTTR